MKNRDPAATVHAYAYDGLGRGTGDAIVADGGNIDTEVYKITRGYDAHLRLARVTSIGKDSSGTDDPKNEVGFAYNAYGQLTADIQEHAGGVTGGSRQVGYLYHDGSDNTTRPEGMVFPDGDVLGYEYDGTAADKLSRINRLILDGNGLCEYAFLGLGIAVTTRYLDLAATPATVAVGTFADGGTGDAGDKYTGLDRFGRIIETLWKDGATTPDTLQNAQYGYNRASDRKWRQEMQATGHDNFYWYDDLHQVKAREQGDLDGTAPDYTGIQNPPAEEEDFCYDETGNCCQGNRRKGFAFLEPRGAAKPWLRYDNTGMAGPDPLFQQRQHNRANEITTITNPTGVAQPVYDPCGNMTTLPKPGHWNTAFTATWDGWNRFVKLEDTTGIVARYAYDGLTRRITADSGPSTELRHSYYNSQWRCVEEYLDDAPDNAPDRRHAWNPMNRWAMILRQRTTSAVLDENLYPLYDAMDPVALVDGSGAVQERYAYSSFGGTTVLEPDFAPGSGGSAFAWNLLFHVEFRDEGTGLYNYGYRYYHPELGRWLSRDPIGERGGENLYAFVRNRPVHWVDKLGKILIDISTPQNITWDVPSISDHFGSSNEPLHQEAWFLVNRSGWIGEMIRRMQAAIEDQLICHPGKSSMTVPDTQLIVPNVPKREDPFLNGETQEDRFGDGSQGPFWADKVLGKYTMSFSSATIVWSKAPSKNWWTYRVMVDLIVGDTLGFSPGDDGAELINGIFNGDGSGFGNSPGGITSGDDGSSGGNFPGDLDGTPAGVIAGNRNVVRARYFLTFGGSCCVDGIASTSPK